MHRQFEDIVADFDALNARDFDDTNPSAAGWERLYGLCEEMRTVNAVGICAPVMFRTIERLDDVELGTPGPLVHTLEIWRGGYESFLAESVRRKPSPLTVWMINRIVNAHPPDEDAWLSLLQAVADHSLASEVTKANAREFVRYQTRS
jgi:hypothetical protein